MATLCRTDANGAAVSNSPPGQNQLSSLFIPNAAPWADSPAGAIWAIGRNEDGLIEAAAAEGGGEDDVEFVTKTISTFQERENERNKYTSLIAKTAAVLLFRERVIDPQENQLGAALI